MKEKPCLTEASPCVCESGQDFPSRNLFLLFFELVDQIWKGTKMPAQAKKKVALLLNALSNKQGEFTP